MVHAGIVGRKSCRQAKSGAAPKHEGSRPLLLRGAHCNGRRAAGACRGGERTRAARSAASALRLSARAMLPFYRRIAENGRFADRWSRSVVELRLDDMKRQLGHASPLAGRLEQGLGTNGIGYFVDFPSPGTQEVYATGITIPPGSVQFHFAPGAHRRVAAALLPLCAALARNRGYAYALASAMTRGDRRAVSALVRSRVRAGELRAVDGSPGYLALDFKPAGSKYIYRSLFFREGL